jgi:hypothetical protein
MVRGMGIRARAAGQDGKGMVIRVPGGIELRSINGTRGGANDAVPFAMSMLKAASLCLEGSLNVNGDNMSNICFIGVVPALLLAAMGCSGLLSSPGGIELRSINGTGDGGAVPVSPVGRCAPVCQCAPKSALTPTSGRTYTQEDAGYAYPLLL